MNGRHFCVSFAHPYDLQTTLKIGQSVMMDNGAFSQYTKGKVLNQKKYLEWVEQHTQHPHWCVVPDVIGGSIKEQKTLVKSWPFSKELSAAVFHLNLDLDWLLELVDLFPKVCLGSSAEYWQVGTPKWEKRMDDIFNLLCKRKTLPWIHGLRMLKVSDGRWPLASADSANVARNYKTRKEHPDKMAERIDKKNPASLFKPNPQLFLFDV
jgi:hypothetical protein